ncbi:MULTISPECIES: hypothetical protein [Methylobacterium]|uniref:Uncharacterized protein n=1 Tax=Methylobacterium bullatum TaxID=570505 RepID=A0AAV4Z244_9HYPH|nr:MULTISPECIES: hypothetical protein [Methylobacterium]MBD8902545.1 hypothetical protein [Methylobacterium bullatum]TXN28657.1 hypothetical protein FV220_08120 [Methylobacterium sp. WL19]GJD38071.1 hypothetical protein OICFNHDK_0511 [Methylobacterium bullatum]
MPCHPCIDSQDQYVRPKSLVTFETAADGVWLVSAHDASDNDILPELEDLQRRALASEILEDYRHARGSGPPTGS